MKKIKILLLSLVLIFASVDARAGLIEIYVEQGSNTSNKLEFNSFLDIMDYMAKGSDFQALADQLSNFDPDNAALLTINYRGVPITLETTGTGTITGAVLKVGDTELANVSGASDINAVFEGLANEIFGGSTDDINFETISNFLKTINEIAVRQTPFDPIAGNPTSFLYRNLDASYNSIMYDYPFRPSFSIHSLEDKSGRRSSVHAISLPLGFGFNFTDKSRLSFNTLLSALDYDGALSGDISFGTTLVLGVLNTRNFDVRIAAGARAGVAGSVDFATVAPMWNVHGGFLTKYKTQIRELELVMVNDIGYYKIPQLDIQAIADTFKLNMDINLSIPYELSAIGTKNGITANYYFTPELYATASLIDTRFFGYEQYISYYEELRLGIEYARADRYFVDRLSFFMAVKAGEKAYRGFDVGFGLSF